MGALAGASAACSAGSPSGGSPSGALPDSMRFEIVVPKAVRQGEPVPVTLRLTITADRALTLYLQGRPTAFDIIVKNEAGAVVWGRRA